MHKVSNKALGTKQQEILSLQLAGKQRVTGDSPYPPPSLSCVSAASHGGPFQAEEGVVPGLGRKEGIPEQLGQANSQHLFQFLPSLLHLGKDVPPHCFLGPGLVVESSSSLLLRIPNHISDDLEVTAL